MRRCFDLARLGAGLTAPNPMVGAVLVHHERIIGEGWHQRYGQAHAEVNALRSVREEDKHLISDSMLYVSLEPCCIHGNTPPCTDLILRHNIQKVVVSCLDHTPGVSGRGIELLRKAGVEVVTGVLQKTGEALSRIRNTYVTMKRPFVVLKFARSEDGFIGRQGESISISNTFTQRFVHRLRTEHAAILVGTNTAVTDNPKLDNRYWQGPSPLRVVLDRNLRIPKTHHLYSDGRRTCIVTEQNKPPLPAAQHVDFLQIKFDEKLLPCLLAHLFENKISSILVEGGAVTLQSFLDGGWWDEALVITGNKTLGHGIPAPVVAGQIEHTSTLAGDVITLLMNPVPVALNFV